MNDIGFHNTGPMKITIPSWWFFELPDPTQYTSEMFVSFTHSALPKTLRYLSRSCLKDVHA